MEEGQNISKKNCARSQEMPKVTRSKPKTA
jgi:hypothetical protein